MSTKKDGRTNFYEQVYTITRLIPKGRVSSYGAIARFLSIGAASRMVGYALTRSQGLVPGVPAHRVVNRSGLLTGKIHFGTPTLMQQLLENEGICIRDNQVQNFRAVFWDPVIELSKETYGY